MTLYFEAISNRGNKREHNEDKWFARRQQNGSLLLAMADGMGGVPGGKKAATLVIDVFTATKLEEDITPERLHELVLNAQKSVLKYAESTPGMDGMGTTLTAVAIKKNTLFWVHVGDCRLYLLHDGKLHQLTTDHRFLSSMIKDGDISEEEAKTHPFRHLLDQCIGCSGLAPEHGSSQLHQGDSLLVCTDGLYDEVPPQIMEQIFAQKIPLLHKCNLLVEAALNAGGHDNVTLIVVDSAP